MPSRDTLGFPLIGGRYARYSSDRAEPEGLFLGRIGRSDFSGPRSTRLGRPIVLSAPPWFLWSKAASALQLRPRRIDSERKTGESIRAWGGSRWGHGRRCWLR